MALMSLVLFHACLAGAEPLAPSAGGVSPAVQVAHQHAGAMVALVGTHVIGAPAHAPRAARILGSGSIIHPRGYVLTNASTVARASELSALDHNARELSVKLVAALADEDIAIVKLDDGDARFPHVVRASNEQAQLGEAVIAMGSPHAQSCPLAVGIVSRRAGTALRTDLNAGCDGPGAALFDADGRLRGMSKTRAAAAPLVGVAVDVTQVRAVLPRLFGYGGKRGRGLGLTLVANEAGAARIEAVERGSPADSAGLARDMVLQEIASERTADLVDALVALHEQPPGSTFRLRASLPEGAADVFEVTIPDGREHAAARAHERLGVQLAELDAASAARLGLRAASGLRVLAVDRSSGRNGVVVGDVLTQVGAHGVNNLGDLAWLDALAPDGPVPVRLVHIEHGRAFARELLLPAR